MRSLIKKNFFSSIVMFRIVEDDCPPIPERFSEPLSAFLKECFHKDPALRPSAEELFEHEWLKSHWGLNKVREGS
jgi:serine/threonine protein kinase